MMNRHFYEEGPAQGKYIDATSGGRTQPLARTAERIRIGFSKIWTVATFAGGGCW